MAYVRATLIVPAASAELSRRLAVKLAGPAGRQMFLTPVVKRKATQPTHYISSGAIFYEFIEIMAQGRTLYGALHQADPTDPATLEECQALVDGSVVEILWTGRTAEDVLKKNRMSLYHDETSEEIS